MTDGPLAGPVVEPGPALQNYADAVKIITASGAVVTHRGTRAYYTKDEDRIVLPEADRFRDAASHYSTALHELAHWTGHPSRLACDMTGRFGSEPYAAEEVVAELATAFLCAEIGVDGGLQHAEYIGSWIRVLRDDKRAIFVAAKMAQEGADFLMGRVGLTVADNPERIGAGRRSARARGAGSDDVASQGFRAA